MWWQKREAWGPCLAGVYAVAVSELNFFKNSYQYLVLKDL